MQIFQKRLLTAFHVWQIMSISLDLHFKYPIGLEHACISQGVQIFCTLNLITMHYFCNLFLIQLAKGMSGHLVCGFMAILYIQGPKM